MLNEIFDHQKVWQLIEKQYLRKAQNDPMMRDNLLVLNLKYKNYKAIKTIIVTINLFEKKIKFFSLLFLKK